MGKDYDGGISTAPLKELLFRYTDLQDALKDMMATLALEENESSLVDQDEVKKRPGKCEAIKAKRKAVDDLIGSSASGQGVANVMFKCSKDIGSLTQAVKALQTTYESVTVEPTGEPGHC